jgi:hypothetical protein
MEMTRTLAEIETGKIFKVGGIEFIKFCDENGGTAAVAKNILFRSAFGENNNFAESKVLERLEAEILPKIEADVGAENVCEFETDLLSLDASAKWGKVKSKISLPTFDFYRKHVKIFDMHKVDNWWWTATPDTTSEHLTDDWIVCVSPRGSIFSGVCSDYGCGVRPFCIFNSSISVSCID